MTHTFPMEGLAFITLTVEFLDQSSHFESSAMYLSVLSATGSACFPDPNTICLNNGRFIGQAQWTDFQGNSVSGKVVLGFFSDSADLFWFFSPDNWELLIKVLNGCGVNGNYWVFGAAATDVQYTIQVTDTVTGVVRTYTNPLGTTSPAITDTAAFESCP